MGIYRQGEGNRGSLKWIQNLINDSSLFNLVNK